MRLGVTIIVIAASLSCVPAAAQTPPCRGYPESVRKTLKLAVEQVRLIEREATDRIIGLDTRPYPYLAAQAEGMAEAIADRNALAAEEQLGQCRNNVVPVRTICRGAALALGKTIEEQAAGAASKAAKQAYAEAMGRCEQLMALPPLKTAFRTW